MNILRNFCWVKNRFVIAPSRKEQRISADDYEYIYRHYLDARIELPFTKKAADSIRPKASRSVLTAVRAPSVKPGATTVLPKASTIGYIAGAGASPTVSIPGSSILVAPGQSIQQALDASSWYRQMGDCKSGSAPIADNIKDSRRHYANG
jgi:hypothetical protein